MGGPSHDKINDAINASGLAVPKDPGNKPNKVRAAFNSASPTKAWRLVAELVHVIRDNGFYDLPAYETELRRTHAAVALVGATLSDEGFLTWGAGPSIPAPAVGPSPAAVPVPSPPAATVAAPAPAFIRPGAQTLTVPSHERLLSILRRVPLGLKPLVGGRRVDQDDLRMSNEYDLQDAVEFALRLVYDDVRPEERGPSVAGGSTTPDFLLPDVRTAIEIKVTKTGRGNVPVRNEILVDSTTYQAHPDVDRMVFVVYDLARTINNPPGFERDLSRPSDGYPRDTMVVDWPHAAT